MKKESGDARPMYQVVADDVREAIRTGRWAAGEKLPSTNDLAEQYDVTASTIQTAIRLLKADGLIEGRQGAGTYVAQMPPTTDGQDRFKGELQRAIQGSGMRAKLVWGPLTEDDWLRGPRVTTETDEDGFVVIFISSASADPDDLPEPWPTPRELD